MLHGSRRYTPSRWLISFRQAAIDALNMAGDTLMMMIELSLNASRTPMPITRGLQNFTSDDFMPTPPHKAEVYTGKPYFGRPRDGLLISRTDEWHLRYRNSGAICQRRVDTAGRSRLALRSLTAARCLYFGAYQNFMLIWSYLGFAARSRCFRHMVYSRLYLASAARSDLLQVDTYNAVQYAGRSQFFITE